VTVRVAEKNTKPTSAHEKSQPQFRLSTPDKMVPPQAPGTEMWDLTGDLESNMETEEGDNNVPQPNWGFDYGLGLEAIQSAIAAQPPTPATADNTT
jgi:hypothetical protein